MMKFPIYDYGKITNVPNHQPDEEHVIHLIHVNWMVVDVLWEFLFIAHNMIELVHGG